MQLDKLINYAYHQMEKNQPFVFKKIKSFKLKYLILKLVMNVLKMLKKKAFKQVKNCIYLKKALDIYSSLKILNLL